jgi:hypothetical protein
MGNLLETEKSRIYRSSNDGELCYAVDWVCLEMPTTSFYLDIDKAFWRVYTSETGKDMYLPEWLRG